MDEVIPPDINRFGQSAHREIDEVRDSHEGPTLQVKPTLKRAIFLPLEGKGDRSAVDEVTCGPFPFAERITLNEKR